MRSLFLMVVALGGCVDYDLVKVSFWCDTSDTAADALGDCDEEIDSGELGVYCEDGGETWGMNITSSAGSEITVWMCDCQLREVSGVDAAEACEDPELLEYTVEACNAETGNSVNANSDIERWCGLPH